MHALSHAKQDARAFMHFPHFRNKHVPLEFTADLTSPNTPNFTHLAFVSKSARRKRRTRWRSLRTVPFGVPAASRGLQALREAVWLSRVRQQTLFAGCVTVSVSPRCAFGFIARRRSQASGSGGVYCDPPPFFLSCFP